MLPGMIAALVKKIEKNNIDKKNGYFFNQQYICKRVNYNMKSKANSESSNIQSNIDDSF